MTFFRIENPIRESSRVRYESNVQYDPNVWYDPNARYEPNVRYDPNVRYEPNVLTPQGMNKYCSQKFAKIKNGIITSFQNDINRYAQNQKMKYISYN